MFREAVQSVTDYLTVPGPLDPGRRTFLNKLANTSGAVVLGPRLLQSKLNNETEATTPDTLLTPELGAKTLLSIVDGNNDSLLMYGVGRSDGIHIDEVRIRRITTTDSKLVPQEPVILFENLQTSETKIVSVCATRDEINQRYVIIGSLANPQEQREYVGKLAIQYVNNDGSVSEANVLPFPDTIVRTDLTCSAIDGTILIAYSDGRNGADNPQVSMVILKPDNTLSDETTVQTNAAFPSIAYNPDRGKGVMITVGYPPWKHTGSFWTEFDANGEITRQGNLNTTARYDCAQPVAATFFGEYIVADLHLFNSTSNKVVVYRREPDGSVVKQTVTTVPCAIEDISICTANIDGGGNIFIIASGANLSVNPPEYDLYLITWTPETNEAIVDVYGQPGIYETVPMSCSDGQYLTICYQESPENNGEPQIYGRKIQFLYRTFLPIIST